MCPFGPPSTMAFTVLELAESLNSKFPLSGYRVLKASSKAGPLGPPGLYCVTKPLKHLASFLEGKVCCSQARRVQPILGGCSRVRLERPPRPSPETFPHPSVQMLEVGSHTRVQDVCQSIATRLQLASWEGCSLFTKIADKVRLVGWPGVGDRQGHGSPTCAGLGPSLHAKGHEHKGGWVHGAHRPK